MRDIFRCYLSLGNMVGLRKKDIICLVNTRFYPGNETQNTIRSKTRLRIRKYFIDIYMSRVRIFV